MIKNLTTFLGLFGAGFAAAAPAPVPGSVTIVSLTHSGVGCPAGSTAVNVSPDNLAFTLLFDRFVVEGRPDSGNDVASGCVAVATLDVPAGWSFSVLSVDTRGYAAVATVNASVDLRSRVTLDGAGRPANGHLRIRGPFSGDFQLHAELQGSGQGRWSSCAARRHAVAIDSELKLRRESLAAVDSLDGQVEAMALEWKRCP